jgi:hypothetical protein
MSTLYMSTLYMSTPGNVHTIHVHTVDVYTVDVHTALLTHRIPPNVHTGVHPGSPTRKLLRRLELASLLLFRAIPHLGVIMFDRTVDVQCFEQRVVTECAVYIK